MRLIVIVFAGAALGASACSSAAEIPNDVWTGGGRNETLPARPRGGKASSDTTGASPKDADSRRSPEEPASEDAGGGAVDASPPPPSPSAACANETSKDACFECCEDANPKAIPLLERELGKCICETPGACATACAQSACAGKAPLRGDPCDVCIGRHFAACEDQAFDACEKAPECASMLKCDVDSRCASKP